MQKLDGKCGKRDETEIVQDACYLIFTNGIKEIHKGLAREGDWNPPKVF
jgi:hypothetical protein